MPAAWPILGRSKTFVPTHQLAGIGVGREDLDDVQLARRTGLMIESQTFGILRDPRALAGAQRVTSPKMQKLFDEAERKTGVPASLVAAVAYLESWGETNAQSPTGPKGVMQIAGGTARSMGLRMVYARRYRSVVTTRRVKTRHGKYVTRRLRTKVTYNVLLRDERMVPERAIPAAAAYLGRLTQKFGSQDWAVFAYHCGEGCVASMIELTKQGKDMKAPYTVPKLFFGGNPAWNRELYLAVQREMDRDFSPTYYFRIMRAEQLLALYRSDPAEFKKLVEQYRYEQNPAERAPHRLSVWLRAKDLQFQSCEDLKRESGHRLAKVFDDADYFGFRVRKDLIGAEDPNNAEWYRQATPAAIGTLAYIAYETRRLHAAMKPKNEKFVPLEVTSLVEPLDSASKYAKGRDEAMWHCTGQVFDLNYRDLPMGEREALDFVLNDLGWTGYLGFVDESPGAGTLHIGSSPTSREFFTEVYEEAVKTQS